MNKVVIFTEGDRNRGFGHIYRCYSIVQAFQDKGIKPILLINGHNSLNCLKPVFEFTQFNWLKEDRTMDILLKNLDIAIIDSYSAGLEKYKKISASAKLVIYIDDNNRINYPKGIVVNGNIYANDIKYNNKKNLFLLGSDYALLRKEFKIIPEKKISTKIKKILIIFGGTDCRNQTPRIIKLLEKKYPELIKIVVLGIGFKKNNDEITKYNNVRLLINPTVREIIKAGLLADIAISSAGQTLNELSRIGIPTITISVTGNQIINALKWQKSGIFEYCGYYTDNKLENNIVSKLNILSSQPKRKKINNLARNLIDAQGSERLIYQIYKYYQA